MRVRDPTDRHGSARSHPRWAACWSCTATLAASCREQLALAARAVMCSRSAAHSREQLRPAAERQ
eukprot:2647237-Prymnesium_polylepis.1